MSKAGFSTGDNPGHSGDTNTWFTPKRIIDTLGPFDLDPCTQSYRPFDTACEHFCEDQGECGLSREWSGRVWMNPPYGDGIKYWLDKLARHGNGIALVFSRTETQWARDYIYKAHAVNFIEGRISFIQADGLVSTNAANGSMLLAFGADNVEAIAKIPGIVMMAPMEYRKQKPQIELI